MDITEARAILQRWQQAIVETADEDGSSRNISVERRVWPRNKELRQVFVCDPQDQANTTYRAWVLDRSPGGIRLSVQHAVEVGTILLVRSTLAPLKAPWLGVRVKSGHQEDQYQELGCEFVLPSWEAYLSLC